MTTRAFTVRLTAWERARIERLAERAGMSPADWAKACLLGQPGPAQSLPPIDPIQIKDDSSAHAPDCRCLLCQPGPTDCRSQSPAGDPCVRPSRNHAIHRSALGHQWREHPRPGMIAAGPLTGTAPPATIPPPSSGD